MEPRRGGLREIRSARCAVRKTTLVWQKCAETPACGDFRRCSTKLVRIRRAFRYFWPARTTKFAILPKPHYGLLYLCATLRTDHRKHSVIYNIRHLVVP